MATSTRRFFRSRPAWFWLYAAVSVLVLFGLMFVAADRLTEPTSQFEPAPGVPSEQQNDFLPTDRAVSECISAIQKPGCGSDARGGWRQGLVLLAILVGLALIAWRIVAGARAAKQRQTTTV